MQQQQTCVFSFSKDKDWMIPRSPKHQFPFIILQIN